MKRFLVILFAAVSLGIISVVILRARFGKTDEASADPEAAAKAAKEKRGPRDFSKSKVGLVRSSDLEEGSQVDPGAPAIPLGEYMDLREQALKPWRAAKLDLEWEAKPLADALSELESAHGLAVRAVGVAGGEITFRCEQMAGLAVLDLVTRMSDLTWLVSASGELLVVPAQELTAHAPPAHFDMLELFRVRKAVLEDRGAGSEREPEVGRKIRDTAVAARQVPAGDIAALLNFLSQVSEVNYVMRPVDNPPTLPPVVAMEGESIAEFLTRVLDPVGYTYLVNEDSIEILSKEAKEGVAKAAGAREEERKGRLEAEKEFFRKTVIAGGENLSLRDLGTELARALERPVAFDPRSWRRRAWYTFNAVEQPAEKVIEILQKGSRLEVTLRDGKIWFLAPEDLHETE